MIYIYSLDCPITGSPKYVGKTINPKQRLAQHIRSNEKTKKHAWIKSLKNKNLKPIMTIIESFNYDYDFWESWYIDYYRFLGLNLKNHKGGGDGGKLSNEVKNKISLKLKGKKKSEEHRLKCIKNLNTGTPWNKGIKLPNNIKEKAIKALNDYRANNKHYYKGKKRSKETIDKIKRTFKEKYGYERVARVHGSMSDYNKIRCRRVIGFNDDCNKIIEFDLKDSLINGYQHNNIINCINGRRKRHKGLYWKYT